MAANVHDSLRDRSAVILAQVSMLDEEANGHGHVEVTSHDMKENESRAVEAEG